MLSKTKTQYAVKVMGEMFPDARPSLRAASPFQYLVSVMLSAQATDISVNKVTPQLFKHFPTAIEMAAATETAIQQDIHSIGLYRNKAKHIKATSQALLVNFAGVVPSNRQDLMSLPGVGRKTADVVLADAFAEPAFAVDTHVERVTKRLHMVPQKASVLEVEQLMMQKLPKERWITAHHRMIYFGRYQCLARAPKCTTCPLLSVCLAGQQRLAKAK
ncbi:endonuclease III [Loigolactobacillus backii]|uniref:endonuclease III n=1 Tax=Loigolactobacillus backii TaxID=375175 RepID=UPI0007F17DE4|nr:endonuclease III [Loigolactobacillus backii]ANK59524.1 endonuclease III [Loigolactobacillus backii]